MGVEDKVIDRGGLTASVVVAPTNDPTQPLSVVQVSDFFFFVIILKCSGCVLTVYSVIFR